MIKLILEGRAIAGEYYECNACVWINASIEYMELSFADYRAIVRAKRNKYQIQKGEWFLYQEIEQDGELITCRSIPEIHDICLNHDIYCE